MAFRAAASLASDFHTEGGPTRHAQLPSARPGRFMRPSLSSRITSCKSDAEDSLRWGLLVPSCSQSLDVLCASGLRRCLPVHPVTAAAEGMCKYVCGLSTGYMAAESSIMGRWPR